MRYEITTTDMSVYTVNEVATNNPIQFCQGLKIAATRGYGVVEAEDADNRKFYIFPEHIVSVRKMENWE